MIDSLEDALIAWRARFDPELGKIIEELGAQIAAPLPELPTKKKERAAELARLASSAPESQRSAVLAAFEIFAREASGALVWPSIEAWAEVELDPRVARMALRVLSGSKDLTAKLWRRLVNCIERHADLAVVAEAREYERALTKAEGGWSNSPVRFTNVLKKLTAKRACRDPVDPATLARLRSKIGSSSSAPKQKAAKPDDTAMLEAIVSAPDDDTPRSVYADWLSEQEDPRGEFITLQLRRAHRAGTAATRKREDVLLADHRSAFLGPFDQIFNVSSVRFDRGFVVAGVAKNTPVPAHPLTRLLEDVTCIFGFDKAARFDALVSAVGPSGTAAALLPERAPKLTTWTLVAYAPAALKKALSKTTVLTNLTVRSVPMDTRDFLKAAFSTPTLEQLQLEVFKAHPSDQLQISLEGAPASLKTIEISTFCTLRFERTKDGWACDCTATHYPQWDRVEKFLNNPIFKTIRLRTIDAPPAERAHAKKLAAKFVRKR